jgi:hypothetical protein
MYSGQRRFAGKGDALNDFDKLKIIEKICLKRGLAKKRELESWILKMGISFTSSGDAVPDEIYSFENKYDLKMIVNGISKQEFVTLILEALTGILTFKSLEIESLFWEEVTIRFRDELKTKFPKSLVPKSITLREF